MERDYLAEAFQYADDPRLKGEPHILALVQRIREQDAEIAVHRAGHPLIGYLLRQWHWSERTFGDGKRTKGIVQHIQKELSEILATPDDLSEWIDVIILAMDGFWRHGGKPETLMLELLKKQLINFDRKWPEPKSEDEAVEHDRCTERKHLGLTA